MGASTMTSKGQATIPADIRKVLHLHAGDVVIFEIKGDEVVIRKAESFDYPYHRALRKLLSEWETQADDEAYNGL